MRAAALLLSELHRTTCATDAVARLRPFIVEMALKGQLTSPLGARAISADRIASGMRRLVASRPNYRWKPRAAISVNPASTHSAPEGWTSTSLNETGLFVNGLVFKPTDWVPGPEGRPIIRIQNLSGKNAEYHFTRREVSPDSLVTDGDLLVSWSATLDTFVWHGPEGVLNQHIFKVIPNADAVTPGFLYWLLKHEVRQLAQSQHAHGLAMMHINRGPFLAHSVLLPPRKEQHRIVAKVDELMAVGDALEAARVACEVERDRLRTTALRNLVAPDGSRENARFFLRHFSRMITKPEHIASVRQAILELAVRGRLLPQDPVGSAAPELPRPISVRPFGPGGTRSISVPSSTSFSGPFDLPVGWEWTQLASVCASITDGDHQPPPQVDEGVPFLVIGDVLKVPMELQHCRRVSPDYYSELADIRKPQPGDVLYTLVGATLGRPVAVQQSTPFCVQRHVGILRPALAISTQFLMVILRSDFAFQQANACATGTGQKTVPLSGLRRFAVPLPPLAEQHRIVARVDELMTVCDELEQSLTTEYTERARLLEALLHDSLEDALPVRELELLTAR